MRGFCAIHFLAVVLLGQAAAPAPQGSYENLNAVLWMQTSAEYRAAALQTYRAAEISMLQALIDKTWTAAREQLAPYAELPPAVILDLDETVLDNSAHQAQLTADHGVYSDEGWKGWVAEKRSGLVPGAAAFLTAAHAHGVAIYYVTNRVCDSTRPDDPTVALLRSLQLPLERERLHCKSDTSDKSPRRAQVARTHRILLLIGDDLNDFLTAGPSPEARQAAMFAYERYWGERWFLLPNPAYGSWERSVGLKIPEKLKRLRR